MKPPVIGGCNEEIYSAIPRELRVSQQIAGEFTHQSGGVNRI